MKTNLKIYKGIVLGLLITFISCTQENYSLGELTAPSNVIVNTELIGKDATHPNGNGSGLVKITITGDNILSYKIDYNANDPEAFVPVANGTVTKKFDSKTGVSTYKLTIVTTGAGGKPTSQTQDVTVRYDYTVPAALVTNLTNNSSRTWVVNSKVVGHFGVGPYNGSVKPDWWEAPIDAKVTDAPCLYSSKFTFTKNTDGSFSIKVETPDGAFTKTGALAGGLPGIPATGNEGCYTYAGGTGGFAFGDAKSGIAGSTPSTKVSMFLQGLTTFIGYGATQKEYEILESTSTYLYLRAQGTETGNAWYLKMKPLN